MSDAVLWSEVLLREVHGFLVGKDSSGVRSEELLLDSHIMISDGEHGGTVFRCLSGQIFIVIMEGTGIKSLGQHHLLKKDDCAHCVVQGQLVLV